MRAPLMGQIKRSYKQQPNNQLSLRTQAWKNAFAHKAVSVVRAMKTSMVPLKRPAGMVSSVVVGYAAASHKPLSHGSGRPVAQAAPQGEQPSTLMG
jgi:hypothetical protein